MEQKKMSKSDISDASRINLTDTKEEISNKIKKAKTDPNPLPETVDELKKDQRLLTCLTYTHLYQIKLLIKLLKILLGKAFPILNLSL